MNEVKQILLTRKNDLEYRIRECYISQRITDAQRKDYEDELYKTIGPALDAIDKIKTEED